MYYPKSLYSFEYVFNLASHKTAVKTLFLVCTRFPPLNADRRGEAFAPRMSGGDLKVYERNFM